MTVLVHLNDQTFKYEQADHWVVDHGLLEVLTKGSGKRWASFIHWDAVSLIEEPKPEGIKIDLGNTQIRDDINFQAMFDKIDTLSKYGRKFLE